MPRVALLAVWHGSWNEPGAVSGARDQRDPVKALVGRSGTPERTPGPGLRRRAQVRINPAGGTTFDQAAQPAGRTSRRFRDTSRGMECLYSRAMPPRKRRPRGHIAQLPSGSWRAVVYAGVDPLTGKQRQLRDTATTYEAAEIALTKLQRQVDEDRRTRMTAPRWRA